jgi:putative tryptophan/tyrosine transport system substrate-binding protein
MIGYVDGLNVDIVYRFAEEHLDRFPVLAADVVGLKPDVILATELRLQWRRER